MKRLFILGVLTVILCLGFLVRYQNFDRWPREGATFDEYAWTYLGLSLWNTGVPTSWSPHKAYKDRSQYINPHGTSFFLVTPYLEHPPLFGLIAGGFARLTGVNTFDGVTVQRIRPLALIFGVVSVFTIYLLAQAVFGLAVGLLSALVYAVMPSVVAGSRIVQNENFFIPFFLLSLYFAFRYTQRGLRGDLILSAVIASLLPLAKIPWIAAPAAVTFVFLYKRRLRAAGVVLVLTLLALFLYMAYGMFFDKEVFFNLWKLQLARYDMSFNSMFAIFTDPIVTDRLYIDGWIYIGWVSVALLLTKKLSVTYPVVIGLFTYFVLFVFAIPSEAGHGWYRYPLYPFLAISLGVFLKEYVGKNRILIFAFILPVGLSLLEYTWKPMFGFSYTVLRTYVLLCLSTVLPLLFPNKIVIKAADTLTYLLITAVVLLSVWAGITYNEQ